MRSQNPPGPAGEPAPERQTMLDLATMRAAYGPRESGRAVELTEDAVAGGWLALLRRWLVEAAAFHTPEGERIAEPNAMVLATIGADGGPQTRAVLCKGVDDEGLTWFTGAESDKALALDANPSAAVTFPWFAMYRQVHVRGAVERLSRDRVEEYWQTRPRGSQLSAWASQQSRPIATRAELEERVVEVRERFAETPAVPLPPHWCGFLLRPSLVEFWQGRPDRLHDRIRLTRAGGWRMQRLQP